MTLYGESYRWQAIPSKSTFTSFSNNSRPSCSEKDSWLQETHRLEPKTLCESIQFSSNGVEIALSWVSECKAVFNPNRTSYSFTRSGLWECGSKRKIVPRFMSGATRTPITSTQSPTSNLCIVWVPNSLTTSTVKPPNVYLEMVNFSLMFQHKIPFQTVILRLFSCSSASSVRKITGKTLAWAS